MTIEGFPKYEVNCREGLVRNAMTLKVLKPSIDGYGYLIVSLYKDGKMHTKRVHRIIALAAFRFYNIPTDSLFVCHLDEEPNDPRIANLALGTNKENLNFEKAKQRNSESHKGKKGYWYGKSRSTETRKKLSEANQGEKAYWYGKHHSKESRKKMSEAAAKRAVGAYKNGELILTFESTKEAGRNGFNQCNVSSCCTGRRRVHKGYQWRFLDTTTAMAVS